jgi:MFS family permease
MFAYDTGIIGGVLNLGSFLNDFGYDPNDKNGVSQLSSLATSVLQGGAFFGSLAVPYFSKAWGRRRALVLAALFFESGTVMQVVNSHSIRVFLAGRVVSGIGVGAATAVVPVYCAEMAPKSIRGRLGSCFQLFFAIGVLVSYWVDYAVKVCKPLEFRKYD